MTELIRLVAEYRLLQAVERKHDGQTDGCLGSRHCDDEERKDLAVHVADVPAIVGSIDIVMGEVDR